MDHKQTPASPPGYTLPHLHADCSLPRTRKGCVPLPYLPISRRMDSPQVLVYIEMRCGWRQTIPDVVDRTSLPNLIFVFLQDEVCH